nr:response regulator [uncultured Methylobacterium sp.]
MTRILIVEDDSDIRGMLARGLEAEGFEVGTAGNVDDALSAARTEIPNAVVLDITLPDGSGHDVCRSLRAGGYPGPILFLSARDEVRDRVEGLALGATTPAAGWQDDAEAILGACHVPSAAGEKIQCGQPPAARPP